MYIVHFSLAAFAHAIAVHCVDHKLSEFSSHFVFGLLSIVREIDITDQWIVALSLSKLEVAVAY